MSDCHGLNSLNGSDTPAAQASISSRCQCTPLATQTLSLCLAERVPWKSLKWDPWQRQMWTLTIPSLCLWRLGNCGVLQVSEALIHLKGLISFQLAGAGYSNFSISHLTTEFDKSQSNGFFRGVVHPSTTLGLWDGACNELLSWFFTTIAMGWYAGDRAKYLGFGHEPQQSGLYQETWKQNEMETWEKMVILHVPFINGCFNWMIYIKSLHRKWFFHHTSMFNWLFGVPGCKYMYVYNCR